MSMARRRLVVSMWLLVLVHLGVFAGIVLADPRVHARYHLRRVRPSEVVLGRTGCTLTGHAKEYTRLPTWRSLEVELIELALDEAERDEVICYRGLVGEVSSWTLPAHGERLAVMVACLRSRDPGLRRWALNLIPLDVRLFEAVARHARASRGDESVKAIEWLCTIVLCHPELFRGDDCWEKLIEGRNWLERPPAVLEWIARHRSKLPPQIL